MNIFKLTFIEGLLHISIHSAKYFTKIRSVHSISLKDFYFPKVQVGNLELTKYII